MYQETLPSADLASFIDRFWVGRQDVGEPVDYPILPDGCMDLVFDLREDRAESLLFGTTTKSQPYRMTSGSTYIGVRFRPGRARLFFDLDARDFTNQYALGWDGFGKGVSQVQDALSSVPSLLFKERRLEAFLRECFLKRQIEPDPVDHAVDIICQGRGQVSMKSVSEECGVSPRQLERKMLSRVGVSPKTLSQIMRFQSALSMVSRNHEQNLAHIAYDCGYFDQSHFIKEFHAFTNHSPSQFRTIL